MKKPTPYMFSIGVPAYKCKFLKECIDSVLAQTYPNFELIIINDCSPELLDEVIAEYCDTRIRYFKNKANIGAEQVVENWDMCLNKAIGEYFVLMGDDDMMEPNYLEEFASLIDKYPDLDVYHCRSLIIDEYSNPVTLTPSWPEYESVYENIWHRINNGKRQQFISDFVFRTSGLKEHGGFYKLPQAWGSDDITAYRACGVKGIAHTNKPIFRYRRSSINISSVGSPEGKMRAIGLEQKWLIDFLATPPGSSVDDILYKDISKFVQRHIRKKRVQVILTTLMVDFWRYTGKWLIDGKKYNVSSKEVLVAVLLRLSANMRS